MAYKLLVKRIISVNPARLTPNGKWLRYHEMPKPNARVDGIIFTTKTRIEEADGEGIKSSPIDLVLTSNGELYLIRANSYRVAPIINKNKIFDISKPLKPTNLQFVLRKLKEAI